MKYITNNENPSSLQRYVCDVFNGVYGDGNVRQINLGSRYKQVQNAIDFIDYNYHNDWQKGIDQINPDIIVDFDPNDITGIYTLIELEQKCREEDKEEVFFLVAIIVAIILGLLLSSGLFTG
jgi:hypothetical protein